MSDYTKWIRSKVGTDRIILNSAGGWVENDQGKVLIQKRSPTEDLWGFPGGMLNLGESAAEAAVREVQEETGFLVEIEALIGIYTKFFETYPNGDQCQSITFFFKMKLLGGEPRIDHVETFDLQFFAVDDVPPLYSEQHRTIFNDAKAGRRGVYR